MIKRKKSLIYCVVFCLLIGGMTLYELQYSLSREEAKAEERVASTSILIAEWIKGAFAASDYILRDIVLTVPVSELQYPAVNAEAHARISKYIDDKRKTFPHANGTGLNDENCIMTHTPAIVGFDASNREWCSVPRDNPDIQTYVSNMFTSNIGELMVIQTRKFPGEAFTGLAGIGVNLDFFSTWLEKVSVDTHGVIAISDQNLRMLARKPAKPEELGKKVNDPLVEAFIASGESYKTFRDISPLDNEPRLYGIRKVEGLPFVVVVGEADRDWQADWRQRVWLSAAALVILWSLAFYTLHTYWVRLRSFAELNKVRDELESLSLTDALTGLANRRCFNDVLEAECQRMRRLNAPISVIMIDVDFFKDFNDTYGHLAGDKCLKQVAAVIQSKLKRPQDLAARYGGEEFCCILPETEHAGATAIAMSIKDEIARLSIPHEGSAIGKYVTVSLGVATLVCDQAVHCETLVKLADERLYQAKKKGRNQVVSDAVS
ncbi:sensor domain-containing diguanylate cyclase [Reinekea marinisedimentorum]|uniref:diguanylate cyclase n=1 Tax=Reinekea marinisedimentorum TaxID=230495 RepID=A0A4R3I9M7_9GAMM|nr:diguanylate cyclase [Reinekea marinisedimentorum]TCS41783.1 diguanylate cyclase (GGDEF)-like protein [Reinekea marinisedimentorum]